MYLRREDSLMLRSDLETVNDGEISVPISLAISPHQPHILQDVLNTAILRMNTAEVARLAQENATPQFSVNYLFRRYPLQMAGVLCFLIVGGAVTLFILYRSSLQKKQNKMLQQKNKELETALANVEAMRLSRDIYKLDSETDKLTTTFNKAGFERLAREQLDTLGGNGAALYMIDLDHFKEANDTYGHKCGDEILQKFATALKCVFRQSDYVGRFGGDEFMVLIEGTLTPEVVGRKAMQILDAARTIAIEGKDVHISASVGVAIVPDHGKNYDDLFKVADKALYRVKSEGRNGYSIASDEIQR
jgi:diguanylate cyclase (GGDEF)-like protein